MLRICAKKYNRKKRSKIILKKFFDKILYLFYPDRCVYCRKILPYGEELLLCETCEDVLMKSDGGCFEGRGNISYLASGFLYEGRVRKMLHNFKFKSKRAYAPTLGALFYAKIKDILDNQKIDVIVSIPLGRKRLLERGYNQSELLARIIAEKSGIDTDTHSLVRIRETKRQSSLAGAARRDNIRGAFECKGRFDGKTVLLVDDIYTTGVTMNEAARVLKGCGAEAVVGASFAITTHNKDYIVIGYTKNKGKIISPV